jgi:hypothetical protein
MTRILNDTQYLSREAVKFSNCDLPMPRSPIHYIAFATIRDRDRPDRITMAIASSVLKQTYREGENRLGS